MQKRNLGSFFPDTRRRKKRCLNTPKRKDTAGQETVAAAVPRMDKKAQPLKLHKIECTKCFIWVIILFSCFSDAGPELRGYPRKKPGKDPILPLLPLPQKYKKRALRHLLSLSEQNV